MTDETSIRRMTMTTVRLKGLSRRVQLHRGEEGRRGSDGTRIESLQRPTGAPTSGARAIALV